MLYMNSNFFQDSISDHMVCLVFCFLYGVKLKVARSLVMIGPYGSSANEISLHYIMWLNIQSTQLVDIYLVWSQMSSISSLTT